LRRGRIPPPTAGPRLNESLSGGWPSLVFVTMYTVYIIQSEKNARYYIGYTHELENRLKYHNSGATRSTRPYRPWKIVYTEMFRTKKEAWLREHKIKSYKGGEAFKKLLLGGVA